MMNWTKLLSTKRYRGSAGIKEDTAGSSDVRSPFTKDADRIVFSPYFRRLNDKTQVQLGPRIDSIRTRLTHSLEASCIGRSLGKAVGDEIIKKYNLKDEAGLEFLEAGDLGTVVAAGCLAHDIGNTPFGHAGEDAIQQWFSEEPAGAALLEPLTPAERADFAGFEGNAQGFRILTRLEGWRDDGGLRLTCATLGAFLKYPTPSTVDEKKDNVQNSKFSYFQDDTHAFESVADELDLQQAENPRSRSRHPLAFLVEAADDISYLIGDFEDGVESRSLNATEFEGLLKQIVPENDRRGLSRLTNPGERVGYLRAKAIGTLIEEAVEVFRRDEESILKGDYSNKDLLMQTRSAVPIREIKRLSKDKLYQEPTNLVREVAGYEVVHGLLEIYAGALLEKEKAVCQGSSPARKYEKIYKLLGLPNFSDSGSRYKRLMAVTDHISSMTDTTAISEFRRLKGII
jgi:dGTPase